MSVSSGSDVTIPIQDSPPPPPSPYANRVSAENNSQESKNDRRTPEPRRDVTGIENKGFNSDSMELKKKKKDGEEDGDKKSHTEINMTNGDNVNEAVNSELINMNIMNTIPAKPQAEFGPYEQMDDYFIPVNTHKKFLRRSEKLYVTKDKRKENSWKKYLCWMFGAFILAAVVAVAVLAAVGIIPNNSEEMNTISGSGSIVQSDFSTTPASVILSSSIMTTTTFATTGKPLTISPENTHLPMAADVHFRIINMNYTAAFNNKSSEQFANLSSKIQTQMKELLKEKADLEGVQIRINEFAPGSIVVKMRIGWMKDTMDFDTIHFRMANVTTFGDFEIKELSSYRVVNHCRFNNNGCSHNCIYDFESLEFLCTCPETMLLNEDSKTCKDSTVSVIVSSSPVPLDEAASAEPSAEPEISSVEPSAEPEIPSVEPSAEPESPSAEPEIAAEPEAASEDSTAEPEPESVPEESAVVSSSVAPEVEIVPVLTSTSTTTGSPRLEDIEISSGDVVQTTITIPTDEEPVPEIPADSGSHDETNGHAEQPMSSTSTTTTEVPIIVPEVPSESEVHVPDESEPVPEVPAHENQSEVATTIPSVVPPATEEDIPVVPEVPGDEEETVTSKAEESVSAEHPALPAESREIGAEIAVVPVPQNQTEDSEVINPIDVVALGTLSTTTTEAPSSTTSATTTTTPESSVIISEESNSQPEEPILANLQRDSSQQSQESSVETLESSKSVEEVISPTHEPVSQEDPEIQAQQSQSNEASESIININSNNSSERTGRQQILIAPSSGESGEEVTTMPPISGENAQNSQQIRPVPGSAEFMHYGDTHLVNTGQTSVSSIAGLLNSKELTGSGEEETLGGSSTGSSSDESGNTAVLANPSAGSLEDVSNSRGETSREIEETTTFTPISLHSDIDVNNGVNILPINSGNQSKEHVAEDEETTVAANISIEHEEIEPANRDHRDTTGESVVDSTLSPVVFDEDEGRTTTGPVGHDLTSTTAPVPLAVSTSTIAPSSSVNTISAENQHGNESENELS